MGKSTGNGRSVAGGEQSRVSGQERYGIAGGHGGKTSFLTPLEVEVLVQEAANGDEGATQDLLAHFRPLVVRTAAKYSQVGFDEAVQEGYVAMLKAIHTYDASLGIPFVGFVTAKLRGDVRTAMRKLWRYNERVEYPSVQSGEDGGTESDLWDRYVGVAFRTSGGFGTGATGTGGAGVGGTGTGECDDCFSYEDVEFRMLLEGVTLSPRERLAIAGILNGFSCSELAELHGVSVETVKTWRKRAFQKLRVALSEDDTWQWH